MSRWVGVAAGAVVLLLGFLWLRHLALQQMGTDQEQILAQIRRGQQAVEARDPGALMRMVSPSFKDGINRQQLFFEVREQLRNAQQIDVTIPLNSLQIQVDPSGGQATTRGRVELRMLSAQGGTQTVTFNPTLLWRKEPVRRYLLFTAEEWRVVRAEGVEEGESGD